MNYESRLRRLETERCAGPEPIRILVKFVDPDPATGVVSICMMEQGKEGRIFEREAGESDEQLCARARADVGWG